MQKQSRTRAGLLLAAAMLVLALGGCAAATPGQPMSGAAGGDQGTMQGGMQETMALPTPEPGKVTVADVRARPAPLEGGNGAVYLVVLNGLETPVRLASISGEAAGAIELHETVDDNGVMKMEPHPEGFEIPPGGTLELKPGGKHVMLLGLVKPLAAGDSIDLTLNFEGSDPMTLTVPVVEMAATMPGMDHGDMPMATEMPQS